MIKLSLRKKKVILFFLLIFLLSAGFFTGLFKAESSSTTGSGGEKFRIGYFEGEPFVNFAGTFYGLLEGLQEAGWLEGLAGEALGDRWEAKGERRKAEGERL